MEQRKNTAAQTECPDRTQPFEITAELSLPDYHSEITRLLWVRPTLTPPEYFVSGGKADFCGSCRFALLYVGPDGALYTAESDASYAFSTPMDLPVGSGEPLLCAELIPDAVISRVTGPRRLTVRCKMHAKVRAYAALDTAPQYHGVTKEAELCRLCDAVRAGRFLGTGREQCTLTDTFALQDGERLIGAHGCVFLPEASASFDEVCCRGEAQITLLLCREGDENAMPYTVTRRLPLEQTVPLEGVTPDAHTNATGTVVEIGSTTADGDLQLRAHVLLCVNAQGEEDVLITKDAFLPGSRGECRVGEERLWQSNVCANRHFSISGERAAAELGMDAQSTVIDAVAEADITQKVADGTRFSIIGELHCHVLHRTGGEYAVADIPLPFRVQTEQDCEQMSVECSVCSLRTNATADTLHLDAELQLSLRGGTPLHVRLLREAHFTKKECAPTPRETELYYPTRGETLWDVAKHYGVHPDELATHNALTPDSPADTNSLAGKKFLLI